MGRIMKSKILTALVFLLPFAQTFAFSDDDYEHIARLDQFQVTTSSCVFILGQAMDLAKEHGYRYVKILRAEYTIGNQSGDFSCPLEDEDELGFITSFEDTAFRLVISCLNEKPEDPAYIDINAYANLFDFDDDDDDSEDDDGDDWY